MRNGLLCCLSVANQVFLNSPKNIPQCQVENGEGADCEVYNHTLDHFYREAFKKHPNLSFEVTRFKNHAVVQMTYKDPKTGKEYVYLIDANHDWGPNTDLIPNSQAAKTEPIPEELLAPEKP